AGTRPGPRPARWGPRCPAVSPVPLRSATAGSRPATRPTPGGRAPRTASGSRSASHETRLPTLDERDSDSAGALPPSLLPGTRPSSQLSRGYPKTLLQNTPKDRSGELSDGTERLFSDDIRPHRPPRPFRRSGNTHVRRPCQLPAGPGPHPAPTQERRPGRVGAAPHQPGTGLSVDLPGPDLRPGLVRPARPRLVDRQQPAPVVPDQPGHPRRRPRPARGRPPPARPVPDALRPPAGRVLHPGRRAARRRGRQRAGAGPVRAGPAARSADAVRQPPPDPGPAGLRAGRGRFGRGVVTRPGVAEEAAGAASPLAAVVDGRRLGRRTSCVRSQTFPRSVPE